jgi:hypothetical protein
MWRSVNDSKKRACYDDVGRVRAARHLRQDKSLSN